MITVISIISFFLFCTFYSHRHPFDHRCPSLEKKPKKMFFLKNPFSNATPRKPTSFKK